VGGEDDMIGVGAQSFEEPIDRCSRASEGVSNGRERGVNCIHRSTRGVQRRAGRSIGRFDQFLASPEGRTLLQEPTEFAALLESTLEKRDRVGGCLGRTPPRLKATLIVG